MQRDPERASLPAAVDATDREDTVIGTGGRVEGVDLAGSPLQVPDRATRREGESGRAVQTGLDRNRRDDGASRRRGRDGRRCRAPHDRC